MKIKMLLSVLMLTGVLGLASCSSVPSSLEKEDLSGLGTLAYVSLVDDTLHFSYQGTTVFENKEKKAKFPEIQLELYAANILEQSLNLPEQKKVSAQGYKKVLSPFLKKSRDERIPYQFDFEAASTELEKLKTELGASTLLIVYPDAFYEESYTKKTSFRDIGILFRNFLGVKNQFVHTPLTAIVYRFADKKLLAKTRDNHPLVGVDDLEWKDNLKNYSAADIQKMKETLESKVRKTLEEELKELKIRDKAS